MDVWLKEIVIKLKKKKNKDRNKIGKEKKIIYKKKKIDVEFSYHLSTDVATKILPHQHFISYLNIRHANNANCLPRRHFPLVS